MWGCGGNEMRLCMLAISPDVTNYATANDLIFYLVTAIRITRWGREKFTTISQTFWNTFYWIKICEFLLRLHWILSLKFELLIFQRWFKHFFEAMIVTLLTHICVTQPQWVYRYNHVFIKSKAVNTTEQGIFGISCVCKSRKNMFFRSMNYKSLGSLLWLITCKYDVELKINPTFWKFVDISVAYVNFFRRMKHLLRCQSCWCKYFIPQCFVFVPTVFIPLSPHQTSLKENIPICVVFFMCMVQWL